MLVTTQAEGSRPSMARPLPPRVAYMPPREPFNQWVLPDGQLWARFFRIDADYLVEFPDLATFRIRRDGSYACVDRGPATDAVTLDHLQTNQVRPLAQNLCGQVVLHGSAVAFTTTAERGSNDGAFAFLGRSGAGKSTLAAHLMQHRWRLVTDDAIALSRAPADSQRVVAHAGPQALRLWADSARALAPRGGVVAPRLAYTDKLTISTRVDASGHADAPKSPALRCLFLLSGENSACVDLHRVSPADALIGMASHCFVLDIEDRVGMSRHFDQLAEVAERVPCYTLSYPRNFAALAEVRAQLHALAVR